jgi:hypothetical protein
MTRNLQFGTHMRAAALSLVLVAGGAATALADPPGYYFQDSAPRVASQAETRLNPVPLGVDPSCVHIAAEGTLYR